MRDMSVDEDEGEIWIGSAGAGSGSGADTTALGSDVLAVSGDGGSDDVDVGDDVSEVLAGAILKNPETLRVRSKQRRSPQTEFTFPSISSGAGAGAASVEKRDEDATFWSGGTPTTAVPAVEAERQLPL